LEYHLTSFLSVTSSTSCRIRKYLPIRRLAQLSQSSRFQSFHCKITGPKLLENSGINDGFRIAPSDHLSRRSQSIYGIRPGASPPLTARNHQILRRGRPCRRRRERHPLHRLLFRTTAGFPGRSRQHARGAVLLH